jgi:guanylate kinase
MRTHNKIVCFVGPSGVGKTSFAMRLIKKHNFAMPTIATTRQQRSDDGKHYQYISEQNFMEMVTMGAFLEWDKYSNYYYGTIAKSVEEIVNMEYYQGIILDLTPVGCIKVNSIIPTAIVIALLPDNPEWLFQRLLGRNSQSPEEIQTRTNLLRDYLDEIDLLTCKRVYVNFSPASWDKTFEVIEKIIFKSTA